MSCLKTSIVILLVSIALAYIYGPDLHSYLPPGVLHKVQKYIPKDVMQWMHESVEKKKETKQTTAPTASKDRLFTKRELWDHYRGGEGSRGLYLAFFGKVYDVSEGKDYYEPGGGYSFFAGRDGTKGFVTGDFTDEGLTDVLDGLDTSAYAGFDEWTTFYDDTYTYVGKLIGNFYDKYGNPTKALKSAEAEIEAAKNDQERRKAEMKKYPMCNSESSAAKGSRVWCSTRSGGIERDWVGVPRLYHAPGTTTARCACIRDTGPPTDGPDTGANRGDLDSPYMRGYPGCKTTSPSCVTAPPS